MKDNRSESLKSRTKLDLIINIALSVGALILFIAQLIRYFNTRTIEFLTNGICTFIIFLVLGITALILMEIRKSGKPFSKPIITKLRIMAVLLMICGLVPNTATVPALDASETFAVAVTFGMQNILTILIGVVIGIISEVFVYGRELQEDNDLIA